MLKNSSSFLILLVMDANQVTLMRGASFVKLLTSVIRKLHDNGLQKDTLKQIVWPYFVNFGGISSKTFLDDKLSDMQRTFKKKIKIVEKMQE